MTANGPVLLCYDGSEDARRAIHEGAALLGPRKAVVLSVWHHSADMPTLDPLGDAVGRLTGLYAELDAAGLDVARRHAEEGAELAARCILDARPRAECGPTWKTIVRVADEEDAAVIVLGARGLSGAAAVLGSVSSRVARCAARPVLVLPPSASSQEHVETRSA